MFDNITELLLAGVGLSPQQQSEFDSVKTTPSLDYFTKNPQNYDPKDKNDKASFDKASLLRLIQAIFVISHDKFNPHQKMCQQFVDVANNSNILKTILTQLPDFQKVVMAETIIIISNERPKFFDTEDFAKILMEAASNVPSHIRPLICFPLLQYTLLKDVYEGKRDEPRAIQRDLLDAIEERILTPLITASYLSPKNQEVHDSLKCFDIFEILRSQWLLSAVKLLSQKALSICCNELFYFASLFIKYFPKGITEELLSSRLIPLVSATLRKEPQNFTIFIDKVFNVFSQSSTLVTYSSIISIASSACSNCYNAEKILEKFIHNDNHAEPLLKQLFNHLKHCLVDIISDEVPDESWNTFFLIQRFCKYLSEENLKFLIHKFVYYTKEGIPQDQEPSVFFSFLYEFFGNKTFSRFATKCFSYVSIVYPHESQQFLEDLMMNNTLTHSKFTEIMNNDTRNIVALTRSAKVFVANHFTYFTKDKKLSPFVIMLIKQYFPDCVYKKYETHSSRWKALRTMLECALDLSLCSKIFALEIQNDEGFVRSLLSIILASSNVIQKPHIASNESQSDRFDFDDNLPVIKFLAIALSLFERLVSINLIEKPNEMLYLCKSFFDGNTDIFFTLISLLTLPQAFASMIRYKSLRIIDLMCCVASKMKNISVDSFYPNSKQEVLVESCRQNLFHANDIQQTINELNFISNTLNTQTSFAYSFVRRLGRAYSSVACEKLDEIKKEYPNLLMSLSYFLSQVWRKLNQNSETIKAISGINNFWKSVDSIINENIGKGSEENITSLIASKSYFLRCKVCSDEMINSSIVLNVLQQISDAYPETLNKLETQIKLDLSNFIIPELHRTYGDQFYFDWRLLKRFLISVDGSDEYIDQIKKINISLSRMDSCTQYLQALYSLLASRTKYEKEDLMPDCQTVFSLVVKIIDNPLTPISTARVAFHLLEFCLLNKKDVSLFISPDQIKSIIKYLSKSPCKEIYHCLPYLLALAQVPDTSVYGQPLLGQLFDPSLSFAIEFSNDDAVKTASQVSLCLRNKNGWIAEYYNTLKFAMKPLLSNKSLARETVNLITVICQNEENAEFLTKEGFFEIFITEELPCSEDWKSDLWPALFDMMSQIPPQLNVTFLFAQKVTSHISVFLQNQQIPGMRSIDLLRVQTAALGMLSSIGNRLVESTINQPSLLSKLEELILIRLQKTIVLIRDKGHIKIEGRIEDIYDRNEKLTALVSLQYCLLIISAVYDFPYGGTFSQIFEEILSVSMYSFMADILENIEELASKKENRPYLPLISRVFGMSLRLFVGRVKSIVNDKMTTRESNEKKGMKLGGVMNKVINATQSLINETTLADLIEEANFFDKMRLFLLECHNK